MKQGFSLVELSIVLVILGLLTGGILAGQNLIRSAELRSVSTQYQSYVAATQTFRDKYFALPGDMRNAEDFWGTDPDGCPSHTTYVAKQETCNGNGNGAIGPNNTVTERPERYRFWQQLANAGLIEGSYTGVTGSGSASHAISGENTPLAKLTNASWGVWAPTTTSALGANFYATTLGRNYLLFGRVTNADPQEALMPAEEAWNIDNKIDDGLPGQGGVLSYTNSWLPNCVSSGAPDAVYLLNNTTNGCALLLAF